MSHFRKMLFAAAAVASFIGTSNTANAQSNPFICNTTFTNLVVRSEGLRELVGDINITCTGGTPVGSTAAPILQVNTATTPNAVVLANGIPANPGTGTIGPLGTGLPGVFNPVTINQFVPVINLQVTIPGTRISNRTFGSNLTDALLFIDDPTEAAPGASVINQNPCTATGGVCSGLSYFYRDGIATGAGFPGTSNPINVFQGQLGLGGGFIDNASSITFLGVPLVQPGSGPNAGSRTYRIKNIRVQVANSFQVSGSIQAIVAIQNAPANVLLNNSQGQVGLVQQGLIFDTIGGGPFAQCLGFNLSGSNTFRTEGASSIDSISGLGTVRFTEGYGAAFKRRGFGGNLDVFNLESNPAYRDGSGQSNPAATYSTESGFYNTLWLPTSAGRLGVASNGTRLRARFVGVPAGVRLYVSAQPVTSADGALPGTLVSSGNVGRIPRNGANTSGFFAGQGTFARNAAYAVSSFNLSGNGDLEGFSPNTAYAFDVNTASSAGGVVNVQGSAAPGWGGNGAAYFSGLEKTTVKLIRVPIAADGTGIFFWEVLRADDLSSDVFNFLVAATFERSTSLVTDSGANAAVTNTTVQVSGNFAPLAANNAGASVPGFISVQPETLRSLFEITNCSTNLLYPFVSSATGFNTGIAVTNASKDPFGTVNETGTCRVFFYGSSAGGGVDPAPQSFNKPVPAGQVATFNLLNGGPEYGIQKVENFTGYLIISCNFRWAHGFAFLSDPSNLQTAHGYLALVLGSTGLSRASLTSPSEALDN